MNFGDCLSVSNRFVDVPEGSRASCTGASETTWASGSTAELRETLPFVSGTSDNFLESFSTESLLPEALLFVTLGFGERLDGIAADDREFAFKGLRESAILGSPEAVNVSLLIA